MRKELEQQILGRWPTWFRSGGPVTETMMRFGFVCGDGWFQILYRCFEMIEPHVARSAMRPSHISEKASEILEVQEKFGGLRIHANWTTTQIDAVISTAQRRSLRVCELCGKPGTLRRDMVLRVRCRACEPQRF